jgi:hypothetical protein
MFTLIFEEEAPSLNEGDELNMGAEEWQEVDLTLTADSGAGNHVLSQDDIPGYVVEPSAASRAGRGFIGVDGTRIDNEGEAELNLVGPQGKFRSTFQVARVTRPLMSIARICDKGYDVTFKRSHASVLTSKGVEVCRFARKGNLYMVDVKLLAPKAKAAGFTRPGGK